MTSWMRTSLVLVALMAASPLVLSQPEVAEAGKKGPKPAPRPTPSKPKTNAPAPGGQTPRSNAPRPTQSPGLPRSQSATQLPRQTAPPGPVRSPSAGQLPRAQTPAASRAPSQPALTRNNSRNQPMYESVGSRRYSLDAPQSPLKGFSSTASVRGSSGTPASPTGTAFATGTPNRAAGPAPYVPSAALLKGMEAAQGRMGAEAASMRNRRILQNNPGVARITGGGEGLPARPSRNTGAAGAARKKLSEGYKEGPLPALPTTFKRVDGSAGGTGP